MTETATLTIRKAAIYIKNNERDMYTTPPRLVHSVTENTISMKKDSSLWKTNCEQSPKKTL